MRHRVTQNAWTVASLDQIRAAYIALGERNVDPLVSLMRPELEWRPTAVLAARPS